MPWLWRRGMFCFSPAGSAPGLSSLGDKITVCASTAAREQDKRAAEGIRGPVFTEASHQLTAHETVSLVKV